MDPFLAFNYKLIFKISLCFEYHLPIIKSQPICFSYFVQNPVIVQNDQQVAPNMDVDVQMEDNVAPQPYLV